MRFTIFVLFCALTLCAQGSQTNALELTRAGAVVYALKNNPQLKTVKIGIDVARGRLTQSGRLENPTLGAEYANDMLFENEGQYNVRASISQKFPLFGRLSKEEAVAGIDIKLAQAEYSEACRNLGMTVETAYIEVLKSRDLIKAKQIQLDAFLSLKNTAQAAAQRAEFSPLEVKRISAECARMKIEIDKDKVESATLELNFKELLGLRPDQNVSLADKLEPLLPSSKGYSPSVLESRPDWQMFSLAQESKDAQIALIKANKYEDIEVGIIFESSYEVDEPYGKVRDNSLGLAVSIPLPLKSFDGSISEQLALRRQAQAQTLAKEIEIRNQVRVYKMRSEEFTKILKEYDTQVGNATLNIYQSYTKAYTAAQVDITQVFNAWQTHLQLGTMRIDIIAQQARNTILLNYALGEFKYDQAQ